MIPHLSPLAASVEAYTALHRAVSAAIARREALVALGRTECPWENIPGADALRVRLGAAELEWRRQFTMIGQGYCLLDVPRRACHQLRLALLDAQNLADHGRGYWSRGTYWPGLACQWPYDGEMETAFQSGDLA